MRALAIGDAAALPDIEFGGTARPRHPVGEVPGVDHADAPHHARGNDLAHLRNRCIVGMRMADLKNDTRALGVRDHRLGLLDADRHRLLGEHMLLRGTGLRNVIGMQLRRRRDIDGVELAVPQHGRQIGMPRSPGLRRQRSRASRRRVPRWRPARTRDCRDSPAGMPSRPPPSQRCRYGFCRTCCPYGCSLATIACARVNWLEHAPE